MQPRDIRYAHSGEVEIAYEVAGSGPIDIVYVSGFISHLDLALELSPFGSLQQRLRGFARVLTFDKRGTGCSGRDLGFGSLAERSDDIRAVMDAAGWEQAYLLGVSEGGPLSILFTATYPERVQSLVLYGSFACLLPEEDPRTALFDRERYASGVEKRWGSGETLGAFVHGSPDPEERAKLARYERSSASPKLVAQIMRCNLDIDARPLLASVSVPSLVVHQAGDPVVSVERGRELAAGLPDAQYLELDGNFHVAWDAEEWAPALDRVEEFITGAPPARAPSQRVLSTVLFTDIVDSTRLASELGDRAWRVLLDRHDEETRRAVDRFGGRVIKQTGDGLFATFDGPARGVQCAQGLRDALTPVGLEIRAGLHTGEVELRGADVGGIGVHIGARVAALAAPGEVLVSRTVHDLVVGSELRFEDRGTHELKGVPAPWQLYAAVN